MLYSKGTARKLLINNNNFMFQGWKSKESIPGLVLKYLDKNLKLDEFISHELPFISINEGFELLHSGKR